MHKSGVTVVEALLLLGVVLVPLVWGILFIYKPWNSQHRKGQAKKPESLEAQLFRLRDQLVDRERQLNAESTRLLQTTQALDRREQQLKEQAAELSYKSQTLDARERQLNDLVRQRVAETVRDLARRPYLAETPAFTQIRTDPNISRLVSALRENMKLSAPFQISSHVQSKSGQEYTVTLSSCTCPDFSTRHHPCKHMYRLAAEVGALLTYNYAPIKSEILTLSQQKEELELVLNDYTAQRRTFERQKEHLDRAEADIQHIINSSQQNYPWLASFFAEYYDLILGKVEDNFRTKHPPAPRAADEVARLRTDTKQLQKQLKLAEYQLSVYESLFPWLEEFKELSPEAAAQAAAVVSSDSNAADEYAALRDWLSPEEYQTLSQAEKFQLALDRYQHRKNKTSW